MEIVEGRIYTFSTVVDGQGFNFAIQSDSQTHAAELLRKRLLLITEELGAHLNQKKGSASS